MPHQDPITVAEAATREFWEKFFNEGDMNAFNRFAASGYQENGTPGADGSGLKKWIEGVRARYDLQVTIDELLGAEMPAQLPGADGPAQVVTVSLSWTATGTPKESGESPFRTKGMNVLFFRGDRVVVNSHALEVVGS